MYIDFDKITDDARLWVYQADRPITEAEVQAIEAALKPSLGGWAAHGEPLLAAAKVVENRFVVVAVDEGHHLPSGCSIDASVRFLQEIGSTLSQRGAAIDFFDRAAAFVGADEAVQTLALPVIKSAVADQVLTPETTVFNTLVKTKAEFQTNWRVPASATWLKRYFTTKPTTTAV